jgi:hypothetical protein
MKIARRNKVEVSGSATGIAAIDAFVRDPRR